MGGGRGRRGGRGSTHRHTRATSVTRLASTPTRYPWCRYCSCPATAPPPAGTHLTSWRHHCALGKDREKKRKIVDLHLLFGFEMAGKCIWLECVA